MNRSKEQKGFMKKEILSGQLYEFTIHKDGADAEELLRRMSGVFLVSNYAKEMMEEKEFPIGPIEDVVIRIYRADTLGVEGWLERELFGLRGAEHLKGFGLSECLPDDAPFICQDHDSQKLDECILIVHSLFSVHGRVGVFRVGHDNFGCHLYGNYLSTCPSCGLRASSLLAVRVVNKV